MQHGLGTNIVLLDMNTLAMTPVAYNRDVMKTIGKIGMVLALLAVTLSCSKETVDNIGRDTVLNIIRTGNWTKQVKKTSVGGEVATVYTEVMLEDGDRLEFKSDGRAWTYRADGSGSSVPYSMPTTKQMIYDGVTYTIQETLTGTIRKMTLVHEEGLTRVEISFER